VTARTELSAWTYPELVKLVSRIALVDRPEYSFEVMSYLSPGPPGSLTGPLRFALRVAKWRKDRDTGEMGMGYGGEYMLPESCSASAVVMKALRALIDYEEHEARECFCFDGERILGPHPVLVEELVDEPAEGPEP
jgi:hypothetical protein